MRYAILPICKRRKCKRTRRTWPVIFPFHHLPFLFSVLVARVLHLSSVFHSCGYRMHCFTSNVCVCAWMWDVFRLFVPFPGFKNVFYCVLTHLEHHWLHTTVVCTAHVRAERCSNDDGVHTSIDTTECDSATVRVCAFVLIWRKCKMAKTTMSPSVRAKMLIHAICSPSLPLALTSFGAFI